MPVPGKTRTTIGRTSSIASLRLPDGIVEEHGGPEAYVFEWLDHDSNQGAWKKKVEAAKQLSLC